MRCPRCAHVDDKVVDSRQSRDGATIRRRRECLACGERFTTYEVVELTLPLVVKRDQRREPFDAAKIRSAIRVAAQKRPVTAEQVENIVHRVEHALQTSGEREVPASRIGDLVIDELRTLDGVTWLRFASVYYSFADITEFLVAADRAREPETST